MVFQRNKRVAQQGITIPQIQQKRFRSKQKVSKFLICIQQQVFGVQRTKYVFNISRIKNVSPYADRQDQPQTTACLPGKS